jgi:hypothetical protein
MRRYLTVLFSILILQVAAQEKHFIYIQNENKQEFYVQLNGQTYNSDETGYVIISQLLSGKYYLSVGFADKKITEQKFIVDIQKDAGFALKEFEGKGWALFDIINFNTIMADTLAIKETPKVEVKETKSPAVAIPVVAAVPELDKKGVEPKQSIDKTFEKKTAAGIDQVYIDKTATKPDTITVFIPADTIKKQAVIAKAKCTSIATNNDFYQTRLNMAAATTEIQMLQTAKSAFKTKCYTVEQVKNLGVLILSDEMKLKLFESAKYSISDVNNFSMLENQFTEAASKEKFKTLLN